MDTNIGKTVWFDLPVWNLLDAMSFLRGVTSMEIRSDEGFSRD